MLNQPALKAALKAAFLANVSSPDATQISQVDTMADAVATAMVTFVSGATVTYSVGLVAPGGGGPVTGVSGMVIT